MHKEFVQKKTYVVLFYTMLRSKQRRHGCHGGDTNDKTKVTFHNQGHLLIPQQNNIMLIMLCFLNKY